MRNLKTILTVSAIALLLIGWTVWVFSDSEAARKAEARQVLRSRMAAQKQKSERKVTPIRQREMTRLPESVGSDAANALNGELARRKAAAADAELTELEQKVLDEVRKAYSSFDFKRLLAALEMLNDAPGGLHGVPAPLRKTLLQALSRFGSQGLAEIVGFVGDPDPGIAQMAEATLNQAAAQIDMFASDVERSQTICLLSKVVTDSSTLDTMFSQIKRMRNSVSADTLSYVMENGTAQARESLKDITLFVTGDETIDTPEKVAEWKEANPDGEDDDRRYAGRKTLSEMASPTDIYR